MTRAAKLLDELHALRLDVRPNGNHLRLSGPLRALTAELKTRVIAHKPELLRLLSVPPTDPSLAVRDVLTFPAALLGALPLPTKLVLDVPGIDGAITIATHAGCGPATFNADEWLAIVETTENDRAWLQHFVAWCERKQHEPRWLLTQADALGPIYNARAHRWTVGRVLNRLGASLRLVVILPATQRVRLDAINAVDRPDTAATTTRKERSQVYVPDP